jgi:hypothetical protein
VPMLSLESLRMEFEAAVSSAGLVGADRLCRACVELLEVDGAAVSVLYEGATRGTFGSSDELSRRLDELQFTFGEGPCLDAVARSRPVLVADLSDSAESRWPAFTEALVKLGVLAVFALPIRVDGTDVAVLDLFRHEAGPLSRHAVGGGLLAAEAACVPLLDLMRTAAGWDFDGDGAGREELASLERVEVYQATGMIMGRLGIGPEDALVRLRAYAFTHDLTASDVAWSIVERRLALEDDETGSSDEDIRRFR